MSEEITFRSDMTVGLIDHMGGDDSILRAMMVSTNKDQTVEEMTEEAKYGRLGFLMKNRHGTPFEHNAMTFYVEAPILVFREWHRHRIGQSYNEQSGRYSELPGMFWLPGRDRPLTQIGKPGAYEMVPGSPEQYERQVARMKKEYLSQYASYLEAIEDGVAKEVARAVLGVGIYSKMYVTLNARSMMSFLSLRTRDETAMFPSKPQYEINQCATALEEAGELCFKTLFPMTWELYNTNGRVAP